MHQGFTIKEIAEGYLTDSSQLIITNINKAALNVLFPDWLHLNMGLLLSEQLLSVSIGMRRQSIVGITKDIIARTGSNQVILHNMDMLFSPEFKLDVLKLLSSIGRGMKFIVLWHGKFEDGIITYAEPGYSDYQTYNLKDYDAYYITK